MPTAKRSARAVNVSKAVLEGDVRRRTRALAAVSRLHALGQRPESLCLGPAAVGGERPDGGAGEARQGHPAETRSEAVDKLDVQGILAFVERSLPRASDLWVHDPLAGVISFFASVNSSRSCAPNSEVVSGPGRGSGGAADRPAESLRARARIGSRAPFQTPFVRKQGRVVRGSRAHRSKLLAAHGRPRTPPHR